MRAFHYETLDSLKAHLDAFLTAYNFAKHLKSLRWQTPFQAICDAWTKDPTPFIINPHRLIPGPHTFHWQPVATACRAAMFRFPHGAPLAKPGAPTGITSNSSGSTTFRNNSKKEALYCEYAIARRSITLS